MTLQEIMQQQISSNDYAFLFAGQTSIGDEKVSDEAINLVAATLAAGYRGVWENTWHVKDQHNPRFDETTSGDTPGEENKNEVPRLDHIHTERLRKSFRDMYLLSTRVQVQVLVLAFLFLSFSFLFPLLDL